MKKLSKHLVVFLILAVLSNGVFAGQMTVSMIEAPTIAQSINDQPLCHGDMLTDDKKECNQKACAGCVLSTSLPNLLRVAVPSYSQPKNFTYSSNHLLPAHTSNLYRPPILI